jgi:hypothetical protein
MTDLSLFAPGLHEIHESNLDKVFLSNFSSSITRPRLLFGLKQFIDSIRTIGIPFEVWLDGSFCTNKIDPNDVDLVVFALPAEVDALDAIKKAQLATLLNQRTTKMQYGCDVYFAHADDVTHRSYWRGWYGYDRSEQPKGFAKVMVQP